ncbi:conjugative transposon protein [Streptococcus pneumoniae]|uniref:Single-stranded DNA-binding protein n=1 Tax=Gemella morbillorum TaxID=29391 RepID=A0AAP9HBS3_9BACL|nr:single-strand binding protein family [Gemella morbillorum M424]QGS08658.1 single-stranded DNA-binding protein [Gemella morbillorum]CAG6035638.1 conjugative transposon protein [Streptococcus pneumoniae]VLP57705.1 conjugative transposon protein [Streptococcus pneumoniae]
MDYKTIRDRIEDMAKDNHKDFVKAVISMEKGINDESALDKLYEAYMANDTINLLHEDFDYMIEDLREQGQIKDLPYVQEEKDDLVNIVGNVVGKVDIIERENKNGEAFKVANFSVVSKDDEGNKVYHNCSAYGEKSDIPKDFKQGDFVKLFGQLRTSIDDNGKEHSNVRILSSKLLKVKEQMKGQDKSQEIAKLKSEIEEREKDLFYADSWEQAGQIRADIEKMKAKLNTLTGSEKGKENDKKSILGAIKEYQAEDKQKPKESKEKPKETER